MKRSSIEGLKANAKLDVRLPDQLKDEFLARCRQEGVSSGAVIRSMILDYVTAQPRRWPAMAAGLKERLMKRSKWIAGGIGGGAATVLAAASLLLAPTASADEYAVALDVHLREAGESEFRSNWVSSTVRLASGEPFRFDFPTAAPGDVAEFAVKLTVKPCEAQTDVCPDGVLDIHLDIIRLANEETVFSPRIMVIAGQPAAMQIGDDPGTLMSVNLRAEPVSP